MVALSLEIDKTYISQEGHLVKIVECAHHRWGADYTGEDLTDNILYGYSGDGKYDPLSDHPRNLVREVGFSDLYPTLGNNPVESGYIR